MRRLVGLMAALALTLVLSACQLDAVVEVTVDDDGSGVVEVGVALDDEAVERAGDLEQLLAVDDLAAAGWSVTAPAIEADGLTWVRASKPFGGPDQLSGVLAEVSPIFDLALDREHRFGQTSLSLDGTIDVSDGIDALGDQQLQQLFGSAAGLDVTALEGEIGPLAETTQLRFVVTMPYDVEANGRVDGEQAEWVVRPSDAVVEVEADATQRHLVTLVFGVIAAVLLLAAVFVVGRRFWRIYTGADLDLDRPRVAASTPDAVDEPPARQLELIVVDAFGVLFDVGGDLIDVLAPFVAEHGGTVDPVEVAERYRQASLGRLSSAQLWASVGVDGEAERLDRELVARIQLTDGALTFLERSKLQGLTLVCLANGLASWLALLRRRDSLDVYCDTWLISSDLEVRKPDRGAYGALREATGVPLTNCLMIDDRSEHLDAARRAGMSTALFGGEASDDDGHPRLESFESL
ncbi:MAG: HAD-IA family hydrolase, partial [Acidimicrobiia bacterium]|nr:HAD-IA family hydrolase [Acidimicrobiia bacterium]